MTTLHRQAAASYAGSALLHTGLIAAVIWSIAPRRMETANQSAVRTTITDHSVGDTDDESSWAVAVADETPATSIDQSEVKAAPTIDDPGLAAFARQHLERAREDAQNQSSDAQLTNLESLGRRLEQVSDTASVQDATRTLSQWLGASERASEPANPTETKGGKFDVTSAQFSDVRRLESPGGVTYVAVLIDAQGNSTETLLDEIDGPRLYETFQLMKRFPLLESVYRGAVMGLLDKLVAPASQTGESGPEPQSPPTDR